MLYFFATRECARRFLLTILAPEREKGARSSLCFLAP
jgi:hypothetical protein